MGLTKATIFAILYVRGDYFVVEKVKPDPLNLLVNTSAGKQSIQKCI